MGSSAWDKCNSKERSQGEDSGDLHSRHPNLTCAWHRTWLCAVIPAFLGTCWHQNAQNLLSINSPLNVPHACSHHNLSYRASRAELMASIIIVQYITVGMIQQFPDSKDNSAKVLGGGTEFGGPKICKQNIKFCCPLTLFLPVVPIQIGTAYFVYVLWSYFVCSFRWNATFSQILKENEIAESAATWWHGQTAMFVKTQSWLL